MKFPFFGKTRVMRLRSLDGLPVGPEDSYYRRGYIASGRKVRPGLVRYCVVWDDGDGGFYTGPELEPEGPSRLTAAEKRAARHERCLREVHES